MMRFSIPTPNLAGPLVLATLAALAPGLAQPAAAQAAGRAEASLVSSGRTPAGPVRGRIEVSLAERRLRYIAGRDTILSVPVAIGMGKDFTYRGRSYRFATPRGERRVLTKEPDPLWIPPDWHYYEKAAKRGLDAVQLKDGDRIDLVDGSQLVVHGDTVGRIDPYGRYAPWTPGGELVFKGDGRIFIPPLRSPQRRVPEALGPYKLNMGDGYLIHGTNIYNHESIGQAVSHGCVRMNNDDLEILYKLAPVGTPIRIY